MNTILENAQSVAYLLEAVAWLIYIFFILKAFAGDDKKLDRVEVAQSFFIIAAIAMLVHDAHREHEWTYFTNAVYIFCFVMIGFLAKMEKALEWIAKIKNGFLSKKDDKKPNESH